tara:strand:- start:137 stop:487 length:351 start_codon:yes stop_codon:yes gene_type:complete
MRYISYDTSSEHFDKVQSLSQMVLMNSISGENALKELYNATLKMADSKKHNPDKEPIFVFMVKLTDNSINVMKTIRKNDSFAYKIQFRKETKMFFKLCSSLLVVINNEADTLLKSQ